MQFARHKHDNVPSSISSLFSDRGTASSITEAIADLTAKISQGDTSSPGTIEQDINQLATRLRQHNQHAKPSGIASLDDLEQRVSTLTRNFDQVKRQNNDQTALTSIEDSIISLANELAMAPADSQQPAGAQLTGLEQLQAALSNISQQPDQQTTKLDTSFKAIETSLENLNLTLDNTLGQAMSGPQLSELEKRVASLDAVMAKIQASRDDRTHLQSFETQLGELSQRLQSAEQRFGNFQTVETDIANLFDALRQNRALNEQQLSVHHDTLAQNTSAHVSSISSLEQQIKSLHSSTNTSETHARDTLEAVYNNLEKITTRLNSLEQTSQASGQTVRPGIQTPPAAASIAAKPESPAAPQTKADRQDKAELANELAAAAKQKMSALQNISIPKTGVSPSPPSAQPFPAGSQNTQANAVASKTTPAASNRLVDNEPANFIASARRAVQHSATQAETELSERTFGTAVKALYSASPSQIGDGDNQNISSKRRPLLVAAAVLIAIGLAASYNYTQGVVAPGQNAQSKIIASNDRNQKPAGKVLPTKTQAAVKAIPAPATKVAAKSATPIQTSSINKPATALPQKIAAKPVPARRVASHEPPVSSVSPRMGRQFKLMDPTGRWSVGQIVHSVRQNHVRQMANSRARQIQTGSISPAQKSTNANRAPNQRPAAQNQRQTVDLNKTTANPTPIKTIKSRVSGPLPPAEIGPKPLRVAAASGNATAQFEVAKRYGEGKLISQDYSKSAAWYQKAAALGLAPAQYRLGTLYEKGRGVPLDKAAARIWYERAAEKGNIKAMHNLAVIYANGSDVKPNFQKAALWFRKAAELGLTDSQYNLGILAERGLGMPKDRVDGYKWFSVAARNGDGEAKKRKALLEKTLTPQMLVKAKLAAQSWEPSPVVAIANSVAAPAGGWDRLKKPALTLALNHRQMVSEAQRLLNKLGFRAGPADGVMGQQTRVAIRNFQSGNNMNATGAVSAILIERLRAISG